MDNMLLGVVIFISLVNSVLVAVVLIRSSRANKDAEKALREELRLGREDASNAARELREEVTGGLKSANDTLSTTLTSMGQLQQTRLDGMTTQHNCSNCHYLPLAH